jgi:hypothetical protein
MPKYLYLLSTEKPFTETELSNIKEEICRLFKCTEIGVAGGTDFTVHSPLGPDQMEYVMKDLTKRFRVQFRAGGKMD